MFLLDNDDYKKLAPIAIRTIGKRFTTPYLSESIRTRIGSRALVEMMFLEEYAGQPGELPKFFKVYTLILSTFKNAGPIDFNQLKRTAEQMQEAADQAEAAAKKAKNGKETGTETGKGTVGKPEPGRIKKLLTNIWKFAKRVGGHIWEAIKKLWDFVKKNKIKTFIFILLAIAILTLILAPKIRKGVLNFLNNLAGANEKDIIDGSDQILSKMGS